jgi:hypothetical protein
MLPSGKSSRKTEIELLKYQIRTEVEILKETPSAGILKPSLSD